MRPASTLGPPPDQTTRGYISGVGCSRIFAVLPCLASPSITSATCTELRDIAGYAGCAVHAYVLTANHVHLSMTPSQAGQISAVMQALGRRSVPYVNDRYHRTGT